MANIRGYQSSYIVHTHKKIAFIKKSNVPILPRLFIGVYETKAEDVYFTNERTFVWQSASAKWILTFTFQPVKKS
jgi:hypothetical protein